MLRTVLALRPIAWKVPIRNSSEPTLRSYAAISLTVVTGNSPLPALPVVYFSVNSSIIIASICTQASRSVAVSSAISLPFVSYSTHPDAA